MSVKKAKELRRERSQMHDQAKMILNKAYRTAEESARFDLLMARMDSHKTEIDRLEKMDDVEKELNARIDRRAIESGKDPDEIRDEDRAQAVIANAWMRRGLGGLNPEQQAIAAKRIGGIQNAQGTVDGTEGGYLLPESMGNQIVSAEKAFGGMIDPDVCYNFGTTTGNPLNVPMDDDVNNEGEILNENADMSNNGTGQGIVFGTVGMNAHLFSSKMVLVPNTLLQDSAFDLNTFLANKLGTRLGRVQNRKFTVGTGVSEPRGIITAVQIGYTTPVGESASIVTGDLIELEHSVDPAYRKGARFMMADSSLKVIKKLLDGIGRPLWLSGLAVKEPDTINGYPYTINQHMADMAPNAKTMLFGDFSKYFIRRVKGILMMRLTERYAEKGQVAFLAFERADGQFVDAGTHPVKAMAQAAS
jgi:HK97 family phage major capsid protein